MNDRKERLINGPNCLKNGVYTFIYLILFPVNVVEFS